MESSREQHLFEMITFEQLNASLLNKNNNFDQKNLTDLKLLNISEHEHNMQLVSDSIENTLHSYNNG